MTLAHGYQPKCPCFFFVHLEPGFNAAIFSHQGKHLDCGGEPHSLPRGKRVLGAAVAPPSGPLSTSMTGRRVAPVTVRGTVSASVKRYPQVFTRGLSIVANSSGSDSIARRCHCSQLLLRLLCQDRLSSTPHPRHQLRRRGRGLEVQGPLRLFRVLTNQQAPNDELVRACVPACVLACLLACVRAGLLACVRMWAACVRCMRACAACVRGALCVCVCVYVLYLFLCLCLC